MQGREELSPKMLYQVHLQDLVSEHNYYRMLDSALDFHFLYKATAKYYAEEGQESTDPIVFFKICLVGYLNNINSDRKLIEYCSNCLDYDKMHQKPTQNPLYAKRMVRVRSKTVEPVLGTLINFLNMKKVNSRGIRQANKHVLMATMTYNLKKYLKFISQKPKSQARIISQKGGKVQSSL
ncbi:transposase, partial [Flavobacterium sp.]|uniref:transposase n=1 Tax=Flavobacterium sp. TaxID=239 RepID=UPI003D6A4054